MKLSTVRIEKFRSIRDSVIRVGSELALVGQNSSGKSSVLRALNAFFNYAEERANFDSGRHSFQKSSTTLIEIGFTGVPDICSIPTVSAGTHEIRARLKFKKSATWQVFSDGTWQPAPADFHTELGKFVRYVYVPLRRDHLVAGWETGSLLRSAVGAWLEHHTSKRDSISPKVAELGQSIKQRAFDGLSKQLRRITPISGSFTFDLEYSRPPDYSLLLKDLSLRVTEGNTTVDLEDCGSGTQSMTALALYSYLAELKGNTYILGIEEPEQNLHPQAQRELLENLRRLPLQILFTTHSTVMLDELRHDEVVLCRRVSSAGRSIETTTRQLQKTFWIEHSLDEDRYYQFLRRKNSDFFFADFVIVTEGPVDAEIVRTLLAKGGVSPVSYGVSIISLDGVKSLPYVYHLLNALEIDFATVVDKDYFVPYLEDEREKSRGTDGFPRYKKVYQSESLLEYMVKSPAERESLLKLFHSNHSRAMDVLEPSKVFCFKWCIEMDLVNSNTAASMLYDNLRVPATRRSPKTLLTDFRGALKKLENILPVVKELKPANLPNSYKRLLKSLPELIKRSRARR